MAFKSTKGSGNVWNPKKDTEGNERTTATDKDYLDGYYSGRKDNVGEHGSSVFTFTDKETGEDTDVWGDTVLTSEMDKIRLGKYVRIQWHGKKLKKSFANAKTMTATNSFHNWEVFVDDEVAPMSVSQSAPPAQNSNAGAQSNGATGNGAGVQKGATAGQTFTAASEEDDLPF
jgi:hypothetical protein